MSDIEYRLGHLPNRRAGADHVHSGMTECGMAYWDGKRKWLPCMKYVNHDDACGYADNTPF